MGAGRLKASQHLRDPRGLPESGQGNSRLGVRIAPNSQEREGGRKKELGNKGKISCH